MQIPQMELNERIAYELRGVYQRFGYRQYTMSKFEEYDLYSRNKDFLVSEGVITFTDTNGKLMALKPDVTLSIVKNTQDIPGQVQKLFYNENVYRVSKGTHAYREIMQAGLECLGDIDEYGILEVLTLAGKSLGCICRDWVLDVSELGILSRVIGEAGIPAQEKGSALRLIGEKNLHELTALCRKCGVEEAAAEKLRTLASLSGKPEAVLPVMEQLLGADAVGSFAKIMAALDAGELKDHVRIDLSVVDDPNYYSGVVFKGFVLGVPNSVLSGGCYDALMSRMGRRDGAIGFAVYLDELEMLDAAAPEFDADTLLIYDETTGPAEIRAVAEGLARVGSVSVRRQVPAGQRFRRTMFLRNGKVEVQKNA